MPYKNKEDERENKKRYYIENKNNLKEYRRDYYKVNKDKVKERHKVYYIRNVDKIKIKQKEYRKRNLEKRKEKYLHNLYGLNLETRMVILQTQNDVCAICKKHINLNEKGRGQYAIDHCHKIGKIRGILCGHCNRGLGMFKDNQTYLQSAIEYLKRHQ